MMVAFRERGQLLILLAAWLFFGGGAASALIVYDRPASELKKAVKRVITDDVRKEAILSNISVWEAGQKRNDEKVSTYREELFKKLRRKDTQRADLERIMPNLDATLLEMDQSFLNFRFRVREQVTSAEWTELVAQPNH
jgi:hypothetical protein